MNKSFAQYDKFASNPRMRNMQRYFPDFPGFALAAANADIVPIYRQLLADHLTPVTAFEVLGRDDHAFLLESVVGGEKIARYSFIATNPSLVYQASGPTASVQQKGYPPRQFQTTDPLADLQALMPERRYHRSKDLPTFTGGPTVYDREPYPSKCTIFLMFFNLLGLIPRGLLSQLVNPITLAVPMQLAFP